MVGIGNWLAQHGFEVLSAVGIIAGLAFTAASFRADTRSRRLNNLVSLTQQHRDIWEEIQSNPSLARVIDPNADLYTKPVTPQEAVFVGHLLLHLHSWYRLMRGGEVRAFDGLSLDMKAFFAMPIPINVWNERREFFDLDFVDFVEQSVDIN
jgi:hypothetical protein